MFQGLTTNGDGWINAISKGTCCKVQGHPDADGECKDVDIAIKVGSVNECPGGYFVKGFYWNGAFPIFSAISKFRCCQLESGWLKSNVFVRITVLFTPPQFLSGQNYHTYQICIIRKGFHRAVLEIKVLKSKIKGVF